MRSRWNLPIFVVYTVICSMVIGYVVAQLGINRPGTHTYSVSIDFHDAASLLAKNEVFMNGSRVGRVDTVDVQSGHAKVTVLIEDIRALPIHTDAVAEVRKKNLLGETYVDIRRGQGNQDIPDGGHIALDHTITATQIDEVLAILDPQTVQRVQLLINAAGGGLANNGDSMNSQAGSLDSLLTQLNGPANELGARRQQVQDIVIELQKWYDMLARQREQVRQEFTTWNQVTADMAAQENAIGGTVQQADTFLTALDSLVTGEGGNLRATLDGLPGALNNANAFLSHTNNILNAVAPERRAIHDIFPHLGSSFQDTDPSTGQHFWSLYAVNCPAGSNCGSKAPASASNGTSGSNAATPLWAAQSGGGG